MLVLRAQNLLVEYGTRLIFNIPEIELHTGDRVGLVGRNGEGKTTLLNVLGGFLQPVTGSVSTMAPIAVIPQFSDDTDGTQILEQQRELWGIPAEAMSGGEKTRLLIARALGRESGALFCDEPTSNLDASGIAKLETELARYDGALVVVSHDRALLDKLCTRIWELEGGKLKVYRGNWSSYREQKAKEAQRAKFEYESYVDERDHLVEAARGAMQKSKSVRKTPKRMGNSEARLHKRESTEIAQKLARTSKTIEHRLERLEEKEKPREAARVRLNARDVEGPGSRLALRVEGLSFAYPGGEPVLLNLTFTVQTGERLACTGSNGVGKTTLLNCLAAGGPDVKEAPGLMKGYFRQNLKLLDDGRTLLENVMETATVPVQTARNMLARVLLTADSLQKKASVLSGGEKAKAALVKLLASNANLLLLDEPTNFLDVYALEGLEEMIGQFPGTILFVSHDRYFTQKVASRTLVLRGGGLIDTTMRVVEAPKRNEAELMALRLRKDMLLSKISVMKAGPEREKIEDEFNCTCQKIKDIEAR
jgi:macrolide transport system ATP-binding/permease protein